MYFNLLLRKCQNMRTIFGHVGICVRLWKWLWYTFDFRLPAPYWNYLHWIFLVANCNWKVKIFVATHIGVASKRLALEDESDGQHHRQMAHLDKNYVLGLPKNSTLNEDWSWISGRTKCFYFCYFSTFLLVLGFSNILL